MDKSLARVLFVDLSKHTFWVEEHPELFQSHLGGTGVGLQLLGKLCPPGLDPFAPGAPIVFAVGPLTALFPLASKTVAMFKSPLTGNLGESHCGGRSALALRLAGFGALVLVGRSETPVYVAIHEDKVDFRDARTLWGMSSSATVGRILREAEPGAGYRTILRIGPAGEHRCAYAGVIAETYRHFGRLGLGAVFGSKNLKALVISGRKAVPVPQKAAYQALYRTLHEQATKSSVMKKYHDLGTAQNVAPLNEMGALPVRNLTWQRYPEEPAFSGERLAQGYLGRRLACAGCPVACIHLATLREPHPVEPYFYKTTFVSYDHEPLYALGAMLGLNDAPSVLKLIDAVEHVGLDAISCGVALAWATEAFAKGLVSEKETGGLKPQWGDGETYAAMVRRIAYRAGELYDLLAQGVDQAAARYGGEEFALAFGGVEMAGYHTGPGAYLTYLSGSRHSHLDSAGYALDQEALNKGLAPDPEAWAQRLFAEEAWRQVLSSLVICFFARGLYTPPTVEGCLNVLGLPWDEASLRTLGEQILRHKYAFKAREGFSFDNLRIPPRVAELPTPHGPVDPQWLRRGLETMAKLLTPQP